MYFIIYKNAIVLYIKMVFQERLKKCVVKKLLF